MITNALIGILITFLNAVSSTLQQQADVPAFTGISSAVTTASSYYTALNAFFPMDTAFTIITFLIVFETIYFGYKLIRWAYRKVPGIT